MLAFSSAHAQTLPKIVYILFLQLVVLLGITSFNDATDAIILQDGRNQREFDYFKLSLQWSGTVCKGTRHCCSTNACCSRSGAPAEFTIHGLWPDYNDGSWPSCCSGSHFDEKEVLTLVDSLKKYWPSLSCSSPSTCHGVKGSFWAHEQVLNDAGYVPSNTEKYPLGGIISAIENAFHATPLLVCSRGAIEELRLCFYKDLTIRDCVHSSQTALISSETSCPSFVSLPVFMTGDGVFNGIVMSNSSMQVQGISA